MTKHSFEEYYNAHEQFLAAKRELRFLIEHGIEATQALALIMRAYNNPLMLRYYASPLRAWSLKPAPVPPPEPEPVKTYFDELTQALAHIALLKNAQLTKKDGGTPMPAQPIVTASVVPSVAVEEVATPASSGNGSHIPPGSRTAVGASPEPEPIEETPAPLDGSLPSVELGKVVASGESVTFLDKYRSMGLHVLGSNGTGKTSGIIVNAALQDAAHGHGLFMFVPEKDAIDDFIRRVDEKREKDILLIEPGNMRFSLAMNMVERKEENIDADVNRLMSTLKGIWGPDAGSYNAWGQRLENLFRGCISVLLYNSLTLAELPYLLKNASFRERLLDSMPDRPETHYVKHFWEEDFNTLNKHDAEQWVSPVLNKVYQLLMVYEVVKIVGQQKTTIDFRTLMDEGKIVLVNLSASLIGDDAVRFLGTIFVSELFRAARSRIDLDPSQRRYCSVFIDEFQKWGSSSEFQDALSRIRKYGLGITIAHQYLGQLNAELQGATKQVGSHIAFRVTPSDADTMARYFASNELQVKDWRQEEVKTPLINVVTLVSTGQRAHPNSLINEFFKIWKEAALKAQQGIRTDDTSIHFAHGSKILNSRAFTTIAYVKPPDPNNSAVRMARDKLEEINERVEQVMKDKNPYQVVPIESFYFYIKVHTYPCLDSEPVGHWEFSNSHDRQLRYKEPYPLRDFVSWFIDRNVDDGERSTNRPDPIEAFQECYADLWQATSDEAVQNAFAVYEHAVRAALLADMLWACGELVAHSEQLVPRDRKTYPPLLQFEKWGLEFLKNQQTFFDGLQWEIRKKYEDDAYEYKGEHHLTPGQETHWIPFLKEEIAKIVERCKPSFEEAVRAFRQVLEILAKEPMLGPSGKYEQVASTYFTESEIITKKAQELIDLPPRQAYVSIAGREDKPLIQTLTLAPGCSDTELAERKKRIRKLTEACGTPLEKIEQELLERRVRLGLVTQQPETGEKAQQEEVKAPRVQEKADNLGKHTIAETVQKAATQVETPVPVVAVAPLLVSRAGSFASVTLPTTPHPVALPLEKTTPDSYAALLYHFAYLTLEQAVTLTGKVSSKNSERTKINKLKKEGLVTSQPDTSGASSGKAKAVYSLSTKGYKHLETTQQLQPRKKGNLADDTLAVNDALITLVLAARQEQEITLCDLQQEKVFEQTTIKLPDGKELAPDGLLTFRVNGEPRSLCIEVDSGSEQKTQIVDKVAKYLQAFQGPFQERTGGDSVTVVFCIPSGTDRDIARLVGILEVALKNQKEAAPLFLVGVLPQWDALPEHFLTSATWSQPFSVGKHALIEKQPASGPGVVLKVPDETKKEASDGAAPAANPPKKTTRRKRQTGTSPKTAKLTAPPDSQVPAEKAMPKKRRKATVKSLPKTKTVGVTKGQTTGGQPVKKTRRVKQSTPNS